MYKNRRLILMISGVLIVAAAVGEQMALNGVANAAPSTGTLGTLTFKPSSGGDQFLLHVNTTVGCSNSKADSVFMTVTGPAGSPNLTFDHFNIVTTTNNGFSSSDPMDIGLDNDLVTAAGNNGTQLQTGEYDFDLVCTNHESLENLGDFTGVINLNETAHTFTAQGGATSTPTPAPTQSATPSPTQTTTPSSQPSATETSTAPTTDTPSPTVSSGGADTSTPAGSGSTNTSVQTGSLANTGFPIGLFILFGLVVFAAGLVVVVLQRRRNSAGKDGF